MIDAHSYAAFDPQSPLKSWDFQRRDVGDDDVQIDILFCGIAYAGLLALPGGNRHKRALRFSLPVRSRKSAFRIRIKFDGRQWRSSGPMK